MYVIICWIAKQVYPKSTDLRQLKNRLKIIYDIGKTRRYGICSLLRNTLPNGSPT